MHHHYLLSVFGVLLSSTSVLSSAPLHRYHGETTGDYIVKLKDGVSRARWTQNPDLEAASAHWDLINGFAATLDDAALAQLRASDDVEFISEDGIMHAFASTTQVDAPWGLQRISHAEKLENASSAALYFDYTYEDSAGTGVDIYIVDTGISVNHTDFGGRAQWGGAFGDFAHLTNDGNGHGTHCAGTAGGHQFGVAKNATLIAVKVLSDHGSGNVAGILSGLDWIHQQVQVSGNPSVVSMSLGGAASPAVDSGVEALVSSGIHVTVAAGNEARDAAHVSPARVEAAITVGATNIQDARSLFSNFGAVVDIYAPGQFVISTWIGPNNTETHAISGTSMATPHVAGMIAYLISRDGNVSPEEMDAKIKRLSLKGALTGIPSGTVNYLAQLGLELE